MSGSAGSSSAALDAALRPLVEWRRVPAPGPFKGTPRVNARARRCARRGRTRELERRFPGKEVAVVPNGVDLQRFRPGPADRIAVRAELGVPDGRLVALFAGHGWTRKGLVPAMEGLARSGADAELWVVGDGDPARYGGGERVRFLGPRRDLDRLYRGADVFVLPSSFETFGIVFAEAAASGIPVIATRTGIAEELGEAAILVEADPDAIAAALTTLASDADRRAAMGREGRRRAAAYTWERSTETLLGLYEELLARKRKPSG